MGKKAKVITVMLSSLVLVVLAAGGYWLVRRTEPERCTFCKRDIHAQSRAVALVSGKREALCCVRCGLTEAHQLGKPIQLVEATDYVSSRPLNPDSAYYVEGSRIVLCEPHGHEMLDQTKHPYGRVFDRCEPSTYAFARRVDAEAFARENSGVVLRWDDLRKEIGSKP
jgi:hypothetical protein